MSMMQMMLATAAGGISVDDVFSADLYTGTGSAQTITNNINLSGEGGLVWIKNRTSVSADHVLQDTERGTSKYLQSNSSVNPADNTQLITSFNSDGFSIGNFISVSSNNDDFVSWTFRKASKFFDVLTYTGNGATSRAISHNLGSAPGMVIVKRTNATASWRVFHSGIGSTHYVSLNSSAAKTDNLNTWYDTDPTSTNFTVGSDLNASGGAYVAYLFADEDLIKCGTYTGTGSTIDIDCGFTNGAQFVMIKQTNVGRNWFVFDTARGITTGNEPNLLWDTTSAETTTQDLVDPLSTGFRVRPGILGTNESGGEYMYMAIAAS
tara:strand:- start:4060 stop:5025 length:966 start_codon:yes stop_codon:yes gene_type:complete